ncbi:nicotinamide N-methylase [Caulobacter flavus]|uniref:Nicotinamide N-methylase n=1 Tax=Caulobacter flavus TaxID=1679497 RepID=A0A2N5D7E8_9CAUL|nr:methyltransferase [Caulobacter flavus]AYV45504.1 nicotinamide N-methylase [Caulobacter flavus]PLR21988.1 nicotinamide N-methylase [Caulobacter flavus]
MIVQTLEGRRAFIADNTRLLPTPHAPELVLHLADEITPLWKLTEEALEAIGLPPPFWAFAWAGGQALARYVLDHPEIVRGKTVVDFATGSGIVAVAAMKAGAASVLAADIDVFCEAAVAMNAAANGVEIAFTDANLLDAPPPEADVLLAGDICYEGPMAAAVMAWLAKGRAAGATVLVGDPGRTYFPKDGLEKLAEYQVPTTRELEDLAIKRTSVWTLP